MGRNPNIHKYRPHESEDEDSESDSEPESGFCAKRPRMATQTTKPNEKPALFDSSTTKEAGAATTTTTKSECSAGKKNKPSPLNLQGDNKPSETSEQPCSKLPPTPSSTTDEGVFNFDVSRQQGGLEDLEDMLHALLRGDVVGGDVVVAGVVNASYPF